MTPWFIATKPFTRDDREAWDKYIKWSGLTQLDELVTLDGMLCPTLLPEIKDHYWPHIVQENFMLHFFLDYDFLMAEVAAIEKKNVLAVFRNPVERPAPPAVADFEFLGYDLVDVQHSAGALTNCGGFPKAFGNAELTRFGLLPELGRAVEVQELLRARYPEEHHADCHVWAVFRAVGNKL